MLNKRKMMLSVFFMGIIGMSSAHASGWSSVNLSSSQDNPSYQIATEVYKPFLTRNPIVRVKTKTVNLQIDKAPNPVGSIVVKFISAQTCSDLGVENCMTTILKYDDSSQTWKEIWSHYTKQLYMGNHDYDAVVNKQEGAWYKTLYTTDGLEWKWINLQRAYYTPYPFGEQFIYFSDQHKPKIASKKMVDFVTDNFGWPKNIDYMSQQIDVDTKTGKPAYIIYPDSGPYCGDMGCTSTLIIAGNDGEPYRFAINDKDTFEYNKEGWIVKDSNNGGYKDIIVRNGTQVDGYIYAKNLNHYSRILSTYDSIPK